MASPQTQVNFGLPVGIPGEVAYGVPAQAQSRIITSSGQAQTFGFAFTEVSAGVAMVGGTGEFAGILFEPKAYSNAGTSAGPLTTNYSLPDGVLANLGRYGAFFFAAGAACNIGDSILFSQTTGALSTQPRNATFTGAIATTTGILTVSAMGAGSPALDIGYPLTGTGVAAGTIITGFLSGTNGGIGTYSTNVTAAVASTATLTTQAAVASGYTKIRNAKVDYFGLTAAGVAVAKIQGI
jgi:hypothetical protein